ncbi:hypothetical protein F2P44_25885 [Massilia sp. CCM 8695]|uniref:Uncharacterized protein n=1 Tax=Massilia frigida TaxID=2609281 RepID=A0ABX0NB58_9BURK|nr:hypothetical protein [Massilia frigida]NHZ82682.1 hypothetical protein [Massilia frigida]
MEELLLQFVLLTVMSWRATSALIASVILALALVFAVPPFNGPYAIALVLLGLGGGFWWHSRAVKIQSDKRYSLVSSDVCALPMHCTYRSRGLTPTLTCSAAASSALKWIPCALPDNDSQHVFTPPPVRFL